MHCRAWSELSSSLARIWFRVVSQDMTYREGGGRRHASDQAARIRRRGAPPDTYLDFRNVIW